MQTVSQTTAPVNPIIAVYFSNGANAGQPWQVGLKVGRAFEEHYGSFRSPTDAIQHAVDTVAIQMALPVTWPDWLPTIEAVSWNSSEVR